MDEINETAPVQKEDPGPGLDIQARVSVLEQALISVSSILVSMNAEVRSMQSRVYHLEQQKGRNQ